MPASKNAPRDPSRVLERRHGLADIVECGAGRPAKRLRVIPPHAERGWSKPGNSTASKTGFLRRAPPVQRVAMLLLYTPRKRRRRRRRLAGAERGSRVPQLELNHFGGRVRTAEHAPRGPLGGYRPGARLSRARVRKSALAACKTLASRGSSWCYYSHAVLPFHLLAANTRRAHVLAVQINCAELYWFF